MQAKDIAKAEMIKNMSEMTPDEFVKWLDGLEDTKNIECLTMELVRQKKEREAKNIEKHLMQ